MNKKETIAKLKRDIEGVYPHFDKVVLWADADLSFLDLKRLTNMKAKNKAPHIKHGKMLYRPALKYKLTLFQPSPKNIQYLCDAISTETVNFLINYVELLLSSF